MLVIIARTRIETQTVRLHRFISLLLHYTVLSIMCIDAHMLSCAVLSDSFATPYALTSQGRLSMEFSRQEYWSGLSFPTPVDLPNPEIKTVSLVSPALQTDSLPSEPVFSSVQFSRSVLSDSVTPWIAAHQASLSITISRSSLKLTSIKSVMPSSHLILCRPLLLLPPIPPSIRVFSN